MRLLYIGQLWEGSTCVERMRALDRLGLEPIGFDTTPFSLTGTRVERSLLCRANLGRGISVLNRELEAFAVENRFDCVWIDKGVWIWPETLFALRSAARHRFAVHYTPDAQLVGNRSRYFNGCIPLYDLLVTTKPFELDGYRNAGARDTLLVLQGYGRQFMPGDDGPASDSGLRSEVCFIGHCQPHYAARIKAANTVEAGLCVWGPRWRRYAFVHPWARPIVQGDGLWGDRYPAALRSTTVALGLLSKSIPETTTTRSFEIPATGVFMLAERNSDHAALFEEAREAEFFASDEELKDKIRFYLANDGVRKRIAAAGRERCVNSGYSDEHQLLRVVARMAALMGVGPATLVKN
jgi:spore maturation protein CgeB